jgi:CRP-like cAMP-binding protein
MDLRIEHLFKNGKEILFERGITLYSKNDIIKDNAIYYIKEGLITLRILKKNGDKIKVYRQRGDLFGLEDAITMDYRFLDAIAEENTIVYSWSKTDFILNTSINWELSLYAIRSLSSFLRILNSEFLDQKTFTL